MVTDRKDDPCPNCGRPRGYEYVPVETGRCQLWRVIESTSSVSQRTVADCFELTAKRIRDLEAKATDAVSSKTAAQRALSRQHASTIERLKMFELCIHDLLKRDCAKCRDKPGAISAAFPDNARIE